MCIVYRKILVINLTEQDKALCRERKYKETELYSLLEKVGPEEVYITNLACMIDTKEETALFGDWREVCWPPRAPTPPSLPKRRKQARRQELFDVEEKEKYFGFAEIIILFWPIWVHSYPWETVFFWLTGYRQGISLEKEQEDPLRFSLYLRGKDCQGKEFREKIFSSVIEDCLLYLVNLNEEQKKIVAEMNPIHHSMLIFPQFFS